MPLLLLARGEKFPIPMRGNEIGPPSRQPALRPAFPIPMRGNELFCDKRRTIAYLEFPIPMRGNEAAEAQLTTSLETLAFPIPMRGNESVRFCRLSLLVIGFRSP